SRCHRRLREGATQGTAGVEAAADVDITSEVAAARVGATLDGLLTVLAGHDVTSSGTALRPVPLPGLQNSLALWSWYQAPLRCLWSTLRQSWQITRRIMLLFSRPGAARWRR